MAHIKRYVISSIENEKGLTWNTMMKKWIRDAVIYWNDVHGGGEEVPEKVAELEQRYDEIMATAKTEYEYEPPSEYVKTDITFTNGWQKKKRGTLSFYTIQG